jgi:hypothetical protein
MKSKLEQFIKRNKKRNAHLYHSGMTEGYDYIICPASSERLSMIKSSYIEKVLEMTVIEYDLLYPGVRGACRKRTENIKLGLTAIDPVTGLTKYEVGQVKARAILSQVDADGMSGYDRKGIATRATHMSNVDEFGRNGYSRLAAKAIIKGNQTKANKGIISLSRDEFKRYKVIVLYLTGKHRTNISDGFVTGVAGKQDAYHIDHMFSILKGYQQKVSPIVIGHRNNLQMLPWKDNISKHSKCSILLDELFENCNYTAEQSDSEFTKIMDLITIDISANIPPNAAFLLERLYESDICR